MKVKPGPERQALKVIVHYAVHCSLGDCPAMLLMGAQDSSCEGRGVVARGGWETSLHAAGE